MRIMNVIVMNLDNVGFNYFHAGMMMGCNEYNESDCGEFR